MKKVLFAVMLVVVLVSPVLAQPECPPPSAVELLYFRAAYHPYVGTELEWQTGSELDNVGFNLYRSETVWSQRYRVNLELIPARYPGTVFGATYKVIDRYAPPGMHYWLEDIDNEGNATLHDPITVAKRIILVRPWPKTGFQPRKLRSHLDD